MAATPAPLADTGTLAQTLALLGTVTDAGDAPPELAALHLTRTLVAAAEQEPENSPVELMWDLAVPASAATEALLSFLGAVTVDDDPRGSVQSLDAATALLVSAGRRAARLRSAIGMSPVPDLLGTGRE
jgi:hypothetical protein